MKITQDSKMWLVDLPATKFGVEKADNGVLAFTECKFPCTAVVMSLNKSQLKSLITFLQKQL